MRNFLLIIVCAATFSASQVSAQDLSNPGEYMSAINSSYVDMNKKYLAYMSAVAHGSRARKVEKLRQQTLETIQNTKFKVGELPIYKGDNSLRKESMDYIQLCYNVFNEDYSKIVNMEEIIEESFDEMQAYLLLQEKTNEKLRAALAQVNIASALFAKKYNVNLVEGEKSELSEKMEIAGKLNHYRNAVYLIFFKCNWQEAQIVKAMNNKKFTNIEQSRNSLLNFVNEGLASLDTLKSFNGDPSLAIACKNALLNYKKIAEVELPKQIDFYLKEENFNKIKKNMDAKAEKTKADVDAYNKAVNEFNNAVNISNQSSANTNQLRKNIIDSWNAADKNFMDNNMPKYKS